MKKPYIPKKHIFSQQYKNGTYWRGRITYGYDENKKAIIKTFNGYDRQEVERKLDEAYRQALLEADKYTGRYFQTYVEFWLEHFKKPTVTRASYAILWYAMQNFFKYADFLMEDFGAVRSIQIQSTLEKQLEEGAPFSQVNTTRHLLVHCFAHAINAGDTTHNPAKLVILPKPPQKEMKNKHLSIEEQRYFVDNMEDTQIDRIIYTLLGTGLRIGELLGLQWKHFDGDTLQVRQQLSIEIPKRFWEGKEQPLFKPPKTANALRDIPLQEATIETLKRQKLFLAEQKLQRGGNWNPYDLIFPSKKGTPLRRGTFSHQLNQRFEELGFENYTAHSLRHTYATRLYEAGVDLKIIQTLLGHSSYVTTANIYTHTTSERQRDAISCLKNCL